MASPRRLLVRLLVVAVACGAGACGSASTRAESHALARDPHRLVADGATLLDVRTRGEYEARHLEGAQLIPVDELGDRLDEVPRDRPVVVYCASGRRSARAAAMLRAAGYDVHDLGSIDAWEVTAKRPRSVQASARRPQPGARAWR